MGELNAFDGMIEPKTLVDAGIVQSSRNGVKILGVGKIEKKIQLKGFAVSKTALDKILKAGGSVE